MSSDIQFGDLEQSQPQLALRPDQDAHFAICEVDEIGEGELRIFVDLDVMRDMEAHALSNTRVELGGVMLGKQHVDDQGRPFVVVTDSLRAEHYEATKGSFKFTHETWSQITRQRDEFRPDLEMVGWYHTHPGWSVFLSGMDLFICDNFFNRLLDVALVIDPCEQDRGWFQWTDQKNSQEKKTQRTGGFVLTTGRFRKQELEQFAQLYSKDPIMNIDPRYSGNSISGSQPSVTLMDNRKPGFEMAIIGMLMMQFLLCSILAWKILTPGNATSQQDQEKIATLENELATLAATQNRSMREEALSEVLATIITPDPNSPDRSSAEKLVSQFSSARVANQQMQSNLEGQLALAQNLKLEKNHAIAQMQLASNAFEKLKTDFTKTSDKLAESEKELGIIKGEKGEGMEAVAGNDITTPWWWLVIGSLVVGLLGSALGYALARRDDTYMPDSRDPRDSRSSESDRDEYRDEFRKQDVAFEQDGAGRNSEKTIVETEQVSMKIDGDEPAAPARRRK